MSLSRSQYCYTSHKKEDSDLIKSILEIKGRHPYYGQPRVLNKLRRLGFTVNGKKIYRLLKVLRLTVHRKQRRVKSFLPPASAIPQAVRIGDVWAMDFVFDRLINGTSYRCFTIVDILSRETPGIFASKSMAGFTPVAFLEALKNTTSLPSHIILDNGPEFANQVFISWCQKNNISLHFIDPGKPVQNAYVESFNGKFRREFLDQKKFKGMTQLRNELKKWIVYYNEERPHSSLDFMTPKEFANQEKAVLQTKSERNKNLLVLKMG